MIVPVKSGDEIELFIDRMAAGGAGVGKYNGFVVFVPFTAPQERILVKVSKVHKKYAEGELVEILNSSSARITPPCPVFQKCGGCTWQHLQYQEQLKQKQGIVEKAFSGVTVGKINPIQGSPQEFHYRNRIQIKAKAGNVGFYARGSHELVPVETCLLADERLLSKLDEVKNRSLSDLQQVLRAEVMISEEDDSININYGGYAGEANGFAQVNNLQNKKLIDFVSAKITDKKPNLILDLYSGAGNFGFPLAVAQPNSQIMGCDLSKPAIERAQKRAKNLNLSGRLNYFASDVNWWLRQNSKLIKSHNPMGIVLDPPRDGCDRQVIEQIQNLNASVIVYVSCNVATLARDLRLLLSNTSLKLIEVQPFDMFPQTDHIEVAAYLTNG